MPATGMVRPGPKAVTSRKRHHVLPNRALRQALLSPVVGLRGAAQNRCGQSGGA